MEDTLFIIVCLYMVFTTILYAHIRLLSYEINMIKKYLKLKR